MLWAEALPLRLSWREHGPLLLVPIGILLMYLALRVMSLDDDSSWNDTGEELEYYEGLSPLDQ